MAWILNKKAPVQLHRCFIFMKKTYNSVSLLLNYKSKVKMGDCFNNHVSVNREIV